MKKIINVLLAGLIILLFIPACSTKAVKEENPVSVTRTLVATVVSQKGVLVGEFADGPRPVEGNLTKDIITWEGYKLALRTENGEVYEYLSRELFYEGDRLLIRVQDGKVISVKYSP